MTLVMHRKTMQFIKKYLTAQRKQLLIKSLKIGLAIFIIAYLFRHGLLRKETFLKLFKTENLLFIFLSGISFTIAQMLSATRLVLLLRTINIPLQFLPAFKLIIIGNFFNTFIPGTVGGDVVKGLFLIKKEETNKGKSVGIIIMDRILGLVALICMGVASLVYLLYQGNSVLSAHLNEIHFVLSVISIILFLLVACCLLAKSRRFRKKVKDIGAAIFGEGVLYYSIIGFGNLTRDWRTLWKALIASFFIQLLSLVGLLIICNIVSEVLPDAITLIAAFSIIILMGVIPITPGNIGWTEFVASLIMSAISSNAGAEIFLYWRIVTVLCSLPGGLLYLNYGADLVPRNRAV